MTLELLACSNAFVSLCSDPGVMEEDTVWNLTGGTNRQGALGEQRSTWFYANGRQWRQ